MDGGRDHSSTELTFTEVCLKSERTITYSIHNSLEINVTRPSYFNFLSKFNSFIKDVFLPKGYPETVSDDYLEYQIWDTCQAFCSSISGTLAMRAVMEGIGVGSETATPVSAAITWLIKDGTGMLGSILFTWLKGGKLDSDCKKWRLFADVLNDVAMFIELSIPYRIEYSKEMMCVATVFKALVGTAGSSTRAAIITHQAINQNIADVSAKDGSQEIFTNLCAFIFGIFVLQNITQTEHVWSLMYTATLFHLIFNYKAVKSLNFEVFNRERYCLALRTYFPTSSVPSVEQVNKKESLCLFQGISEYNMSGFSFKLGACMERAMRSNEIKPEGINWLFSLFQNRRYFIFPRLKKKKLFLTFHGKFKENDVLKAYFHACLIAISISYFQRGENLSIVQKSRTNSLMQRLQKMLNEVQISESPVTNSEGNEDMVLKSYTVCDYLIDKEFIAFLSACEDEGWRVTNHLLAIGDWRGNWKSKKQREIKFQVKDQQGRRPSRQSISSSSPSPSSPSSPSSSSSKISGTMHLVIA